MHTPADNQKCPQPEETNNDNNTTRMHRQRCHQQMSPAFRSRFVINPTPIPLQHQRQFENALTMSHSVWEKESYPTPDLLSRLQPFQQGRTVKKPSSSVIPLKETRV